MEVFIMWAGGIIIGGIFTLIGWVLKMIFTAIKDQRINHNDLSDRLSAYKLHTVETFATKADVDQGFNRVMDKLETMDNKSDAAMIAIHLKIDTKADK